MKNSKLVHYLNEGVKVKHYDAERERNCILDIQYLWNKDEVVCTDSDNEYVIPIKEVTPYLYPLCLTESIPYDGRMVVPLVELAEIDGFYCEGDKYKIAGDKIIISNSAFYYKNGTFYHLNGIDDKNSSDYSLILNQLSLFQLLLKMRINIFPNEIESADPRIELVNPYTI